MIKQSWRGELETGMSMFTASYPMRTSEGIIEDKDILAGLSAKLIDALILRQREWTRITLE
jgi:hypothetical protein